MTGISEGTATITATADGASGTSEIRVEYPDRAALVALYEATDGPNWINNDNWLTDAPLGDWYGVTADGSGRVVELRLHGVWDAGELTPHGLTGSLPSELGNLANLVWLYLAGNTLEGPIPAELGDLANLRFLLLSANTLEGPIPPELGNLANLFRLDLMENNLEGPIPPELGNLAKLVQLYLYDNALNGPIPPEFGNLARLSYLNLGSNALEGAIPPEMGNLANLVFLRLDGNDDLDGPLPRSFLQLGSLQTLWADGTGLCAPSDAAFQEWLNGLSSVKVAMCEGSRPTTVTVTPATATLSAFDATVRLAAQVLDQDGQTMAGTTVTWASSKASVATVDASGQVTAVGNGETTIAATAGSAAGTAVVTVAQEVSAITVSPTADTLMVADTVRLTAAALDANGHAVEAAEFDWSSSDASVARVDGSGLVTGVAEGQATVTAAAGDATATAEITVTAGGGGSGLMRLTNNPAIDLPSEWSPDGTRILFWSDRDGDQEIYVMNADGSGVTRLTNAPGRDLDAQWSPDGSRILFLSERHNPQIYNPQIYVMNADGSGVTRLTNDDFSSLAAPRAWSPDGSRILFRRGVNLRSEIYVMNADGSGVTHLTGNNDSVGNAAYGWSPDGTRILFGSQRDGNREIYVMNADGSGVTRLTNNAAADFPYDWSPDGSRILFFSDRDGNFEIYVIRLH